MVSLHQSFGASSNVTWDSFKACGTPHLCVLLTLFSFFKILYHKICIYPLVYMLLRFISFFKNKSLLKSLSIRLESIEIFSIEFFRQVLEAFLNVMWVYSESKDCGLPNFYLCFFSSFKNLWILNKHVLALIFWNILPSIFPSRLWGFFKYFMYLSCL